MILSKLLFKPKWQDKDPASRKAAIAADSDDAELVAALPEIARRDEDPGVRLAALQRLGDYEAWRERSTGDAQGSVRNVARETYLSMLCSGSGAPSVARRIAELETLSEDEIERVATSAADVDLRRQAVARVSKQTLLAQRAAADPDAMLRLQLLERITDTTLLERIAERTRKTDKAVSRRARERLQASRIGAGDATAIAAHAQTLCERAEALMRTSPANAATLLAEIEAEWDTLGNTVPAPLSARFHGARTLVRKAGEPRPAVVHESLPPVVEPPAPPQPETIVTPPRIDEAAAERARMERARQKALRDEFENIIRDFSAALESGDSAVAHRLHAQLEERRKQLRDVAPELRARLDALQPRYAELKRWQHWSNNQRRRILCADIENLVDSGAHPDAVATRVREAREEWRHMNAAEGLADDTEAAAGIAQRFHGVCARALRPTRAYFAKRKEVRQTHADEIEALVSRASAIGDDSSDWKGIAELRTQASTALRALDGVDPRRRAQIATQLKGVIARMSALAGAHESEVEAAKARMIAQATALSAGGNANAARETRDLQKRWTALGNGRRNTDQKQWREFRAACDAVFGKLDETRKQREEAATAAQAQTQQLLDEYAALAALGDDAESAKKQLRDLDARWQSGGSDDRAMLKRQRELRDAIALNLKNSERHRRLRHFTAAMQKYAALRLQETGGPAAVMDNLPSAADFDASLSARHAGETIDMDEAAARATLVSLEFLAGVESPGEDRQLRMNHQVQRLSTRMREGARAEPERELADLLKRWFAQAPQPLELEQRFAVAARTAIDSLP